MANPCLSPQQSDFRGYPWEEYTETKTEQFQRNNCPSGQSGSWVSYSKTYTSYLSEDDLQAQIAADTTNFNAAGQANANSTGTCSVTCLAGQYPATYNFAAMSSSQVWVNGGGYSGILSPYSKSTVLSNANLPAQVTLNNLNKPRTGWMTPYPHTSLSNAYGVWINGNSLFVSRRDYSVGNACSLPIDYHVGNLKATANDGVRAHDFYVMGNGGVLMLIGYPHATGIKNFDVWYWREGIGGSLILEVGRPHSSVYYAYSGKIAYNGSSAYMMLAFASKNNSKRTRTAFYQTQFSPVTGDPTSSGQIIPFDYSNQHLVVYSGGFAGGRVFFVYEENSSMRTYPLVGGSVAAPPNAMRNRGFTYMRDPYSTNDCYFGWTAYGATTNVLFRYNASTNSWNTVK